MGNEVNKIAKKFKKKGPPPKKEPTTAEVKTFIMVAQSKLTLFRNKRVQAIKSKRKEIANCLKDNNLDVAKAKMSTIIGDEDIITVYDILGPILEIMKEKVSYLMMHNDCPIDLKSHVDTVIYSSSRLEVEELHKIRDLIRMKYGEMYISKGDSNADNLVNKNLIEKLRAKQQSDTLLTIRLKQLCKEENINFEFPFDVGAFECSEPSGMGGNAFAEPQNVNPYESRMGGVGMEGNQNFNNIPMGGYGNQNQMNQGDFGTFGQQMGNGNQGNMGGQGFGQMNGNQNPYGDDNFGGNQQNNPQDFGGFGGFNNNFNSQGNAPNKQNDFPSQHFGNNDFPQDNFQNNPSNF